VNDVHRQNWRPQPSDFTRGLRAGLVIAWAIWCAVALAYGVATHA
jgi:hypothetical protein